MKTSVVIILIVFFGLPGMAQEEVHLPPSVLAAAGGSDGSATHLSQWRLSIVHVVTLPGVNLTENQDLYIDNSEVGWSVSLFPNPFEKNLSIEFQLTSARDFIIKLIDVTGQVLMIRQARIILPGEIIELNLSRFASALYLLHISTPDQQTRKIYRVQKI
jgi:hypothetical protein